MCVCVWRSVGGHDRRAEEDKESRRLRFQMAVDLTQPSNFGTFFGCSLCLRSGVI